MGLMREVMKILVVHCCFDFKFNYKDEVQWRECFFVQNWKYIFHSCSSLANTSLKLNLRVFIMIVHISLPEVHVRDQVRLKLRY